MTVNDIKYLISLYIFYIKTKKITLIKSLDSHISILTYFTNSLDSQKLNALINRSFIRERSFFQYLFTDVFFNLTIAQIEIIKLL